MSTQSHEETTRTLGRRGLLSAAALGGAGIALASVSPLRALADTAAGNESVQDIINIALIAENLATTFYYTGLTTSAIVSDAKLAGSSGDPNNVGSDGDAGNVAYFQAALDQEVKHAAALSAAGATSPVTQYYFPATTFQSLGYTSTAGSFLWVLDHLETAFIGAYLAAMHRFGELGHPELSELAGQILGVESEHRALGRVVAGDDPANNVTVEVVSFTHVSDAATALAPFLTGKGFPGAATPAIGIPTADQIATTVGVNKSS